MIVVTFFGFLVAFLIVGLDAIQTSHSTSVIFVSGIITVCAMILPGISGAFILWFLGQYEYLLHALNNLKITTILVYVIGALLGILAFSHVLSYAIKRYRVLTLSFLLGLMVGALRKPVEIVIAQPDNIAITISSGLLGIFIVYMFSYYQLILNKRT
jgi:putative membrane protein